VVPDSPFRVSDVDGRPKSVSEPLPDRVVAVERDGIADGHVLHSLAHIVHVAFKRELRGVDADHDQPLILILLGPRADIGERAEPVDAGIGPEVDENDLPLHVRSAERGRVEPAGRPIEPRQVSLHG
jgi:hypothetical protein